MTSPVLYISHVCVHTGTPANNKKFSSSRQAFVLFLDANTGVSVSIFGKNSWQEFLRNPLLCHPQKNAISNFHVSLFKEPDEQ